jgi:hypothetical protein
MGIIRLRLGVPSTPRLGTSTLSYIFTLSSLFHDHASIAFRKVHDVSMRQLRLKDSLLHDSGVAAS